MIIYAFYTREGELPASATITWSLWAIFAHQTAATPFYLRGLAFGFSLFASACVLKIAIGRLFHHSDYVEIHDDEGDSLVG